jgi:hypothetical protein
MYKCIVVRINVVKNLILYLGVTIFKKDIFSVILTLDNETQADAIALGSNLDNSQQILGAAIQLLNQQPEIKLLAHSA